MATRSKKPRRKTNSRAKGVAAVPPSHFNAILIENIEPQIDGGRFPVKTVVGRPFTVRADIYKDGHDILGAQLKVTKRGGNRWTFIPMKALLNDRWEASFVPEEIGHYVYAIEGWADLLATWLERTERKCRADREAGDYLPEGLDLLRRLQKKLDPKNQPLLSGFIRGLEKSKGSSDEVLRILKDLTFDRLARTFPLKAHESFPEAMELIVDRKEAEYSAWYELFPRSQGKHPERHGTFKDTTRRLADIKKMGFDVIYLPPIHPIGTTNRKGPNNTLVPALDSPGSPWAIGGQDGGHKAIHPELGTMKDFEELVTEAGKMGIEIALDFAAQCSPDHPYVREHPDWFYRLPDGTIRFAENPPKKYQDIYPLDFYCKDREALWQELRSVFLFWVGKGVKIFRVDNPHTKPLKFWLWVIREIQEIHPEVIFLAEAFTRSKVMKYLAKAGFTQSYTYFTWRNAKWEIRQYLEELLTTDMRFYFRGNFFANTPDILHEYLQKGGPAAFKIRLILASTLSSVYGIYSGYELCENTPLREGSEEYMHSEKYEIRVRDWDQPGNIKEFISRINRIRSENEALQQYPSLEFFETRNENMLAYGKWNKDKSNVIVVVVNLDPFTAHEDLIAFPTGKFGIEDWQTYQMKDLLSGEKYDWKGREQYVRLDPAVQPAHVFQLRR